MKNVKVSYNVKDTKKDSFYYGLLVERNKKFETLEDAMKFVASMKITKDGLKVVGTPVIETL